MNHQDTKVIKSKQMGRSAGRLIGRFLLPTLRPAHLPICLLFTLLVAISAHAQVASHTPVVAPASTESNVIFQPVGRPVVRVNGTTLTDRDLLREMFNIFPYARVHDGFPKGMEADIREGAMKMIIFEELVYQEARRRNMTVPPADLARARRDFRAQFNSPQEYQQFLQTEFHGSEQLLRAKVERSLLIDKLLKQEVTDKAVVSPAEVKAYYDQHPERFQMPESFSFQSISVLPPPNATPAQLGEGRKRAANALRQAKATKSYEEFGMLAEKISEDDFRVMMGDHKAADRSKLPPPVVKALLAMQPGQVSDLIEFDAGDYTILTLNTHLPAGIQKFESIQGLLHDNLTKEKIEQLRSALATKLSRKAKIEKA